MTSSILYAYFRSLNPPQDAFTPLYIPIVNIPASDLSLRPEYVALYRHANISASHLITLDDLPEFSKLEKQLLPAQTRWILVDHNKLQGCLGSIYASRVHGVIDHHDDEGMVFQKTDPEPRIVEKCGSCTSLVINYFRASWDTIANSSLSAGAAHAQGDSLSDDSAVTKTWDAQVAKLAIASILVDTANLNAKGKVEIVDREGVNYLEAKIHLSPKDARVWNRIQFYQEINNAKGSLDSLLVKDILRKDYKEWKENGKILGIASAVKPLKFLIEKASNEQSSDANGDAFGAAVHDFMMKRELSIFGIMTASTSADNHFRRELFLQAMPDSLAVANCFVEEATSKLGLEDLEISTFDARPADAGMSKPWRKVWLQRKVENSRKQVAPLLRKAMN